MSVMSVKTGTKSWSDSNQSNITKGDGLNTNSAHDLAKLGNEDVGNLLNKIADPNWVDPSKKVRAVGSDKMDKDSFMKLMLAQMKHQDPSNPMQSHELAAQLAQFSSVEQLQNVNTTLTEMKAGQKPAESFQALNFIGKAVSGDSAKITRLKGDKDHDFSFTLNGDAKEAVIRIRNVANGETVRSISLKDLKKGPNNFTWNGLDERGQAATSGDYQMFLEATASNGAKVAAKTDFEGMITGVNYTAEGPVLLVGSQTVKLKDVKKIVDPSLMKNDQFAKSSAGQDLKNNQVTSQNKERAENEKRAEDPPLQTPATLMDTVSMSREMISKLDQETKSNDGSTPDPTNQAGKSADLR